MNTNNEKVKLLFYDTNVWENQWAWNNFWDIKFKKVIRKLVNEEDSTNESNTNVKCLDFMVYQKQTKQAFQCEQSYHRIFSVLDSLSFCASK